METSTRSIPALTFLLLFVHNAMGICLNGHPSLALEYQKSYAVFIGVVISEKPEAPSGGLFEDGTSYVVRVREAFRGKPSQTLTLFSENSSGRFPMKVNEAYLLFVYQQSGRTMVDNCGNSKLLSLATKDIAEIRRLQLFPPAPSTRSNLPAHSFPKGAVILERRDLPTIANRAMAIWMINPKCSDPIPEDDPYTCPDETRGNALSGPTRVSLINVSEENIINTIEIRDPHFPQKDTFDVPRKIRPGFYYLVKPSDSLKANKPTILNYQDLNGDGDPTEFVFYDALFCMGLQTTLVGYSRSKDRVIQYPLVIDFKRGDKEWEERSVWLEYIFSKKSAAPGHFFQFDADYRGRGEWLASYDVVYDRSLEAFRGICKITDK